MKMTREKALENAKNYWRLKELAGGKDKTQFFICCGLIAAYQQIYQFTDWEISG